MEQMGQLVALYSLLLLCCSKLIVAVSQSVILYAPYTHVGAV